jgi:ABC-type Na+ transport system ATPase subunit NatA
MRAVAGNTWGACKSTLLTMYKTLIRPIIDYGCIAYDSASVVVVVLL